MMIEILLEGPYAEFVGDKINAVKRAVGDRVKYPAEYAQFLISRNLAKLAVVVEAAEPVTAIVSPDRAEDVTRHGPEFNLTDDEALEKTGLVQPKNKRRRA